MQTNRLGDLPKEEPGCTLDIPGPNVVNLKVGSAHHLLVEIAVMSRQALQHFALVAWPIMTQRFEIFSRRGLIVSTRDL